MKSVVLKQINMKNHPQCNEKWLQNIIANDPGILGIGNLELRDKERRQGHGRIDLLLQESDGYGRYEVEIQLGPTDESHIIRTLEYWDIERKRYPQYEHTAVIIAEDITSRFFNVISLFNGFLPIIALKVSAIETSDGIGLHFTKVLDRFRLGYVDEDEEIGEQVDRNFWENSRASPQTVKIADQVLGIAKEFIPNIDLSYNKHYIGFWVDGKACNFATCKPLKNSFRLSVRIPKSSDVDQKLDVMGLDVLDYDNRWGQYRVRLTAEEVQKHREFLKALMSEAYGLRV